MRVCVRHAVQDEARRGDEAVAAFLLDAGQAGEELVGDVLAEPGLAEAAAGDGRGFPARPWRSCRPRAKRLDRESAPVSTSWILPRLWSRRLTSSQSASGVTMRQDARLSSAVPHSTAFLPPAFMATLPPMQRGVGRGRVDREHQAGGSAASITRRVTTPAPQWMVGTGFRHAGQVTHFHRAQCCRAFRC